MYVLNSFVFCVYCRRYGAHISVVSFVFPHGYVFNLDGGTLYIAPERKRRSSCLKHDAEDASISCKPVCAVDYFLQTAFEMVGVFKFIMAIYSFMISCLPAFTELIHESSI